MHKNVQTWLNLQYFFRGTLRKINEENISSEIYFYTLFLVNLKSLIT